MRVPDKTLRDLEWFQVTGRLASFAVTAWGKDLCSKLVPFDTGTQAATRARAVTEMIAFLDSGRDISFGESSDLRPLFPRLKRQAGLEVDEILSLARALSAGSRTRRLLLELGDEFRELARLCGAAPDLGELAEEVLDCFNEKGEVMDWASPALSDLRKQVDGLKNSARNKIEKLVESSDIALFLQDDYYTVRGDRYVLPVKVEYKGKVGGVVHHYSDSGQTVFMEPPEMVEINNRLISTQAELEMEEHKLLLEISGKLGERHEEIEDVLKTSALMDLVRASALMAKHLGAVEPSLPEDGVTWRLDAARHPILVLTGADVVANDIELGGKCKVLVVTGANAGGKTVTLKTLGLSTLMAAAGLHVPAAEAVVPHVSCIFTDMGDDQSILDAMSTFSAHMANISTILDESAPGDLVLLDELAVGTEPEQGAALAVAITEYLADKGAYTAVTSHYAALKARAESRPDFENAGVCVDPKTGSPTYRLEYGVPGASDAFALARKVGLPEGVITRASELCGSKAVGLEEMFKVLKEKLDLLDRERLAIEQEKKAAALEARQELELQRTILLDKEEELSLLKRKLEELLDKARNELAEVVRTAQRSGSLKVVKRARDTLKVIQRQADEASLPTHVGAGEVGIGTPPGLDLESLQQGMRVIVSSLGKEGVIVQPPKAGKVRVRVGNLEGRFPITELEPVSSDVAMRTGKGKNVSNAPLKECSGHAREAPAGEDASVPDLSEAYVTPDTTCDLRGLRTFEAEERVDAFLDAMFRQKHRFAMIIHGHGTGALRDLVRKMLERSPYIKAWRPGKQREGGNGVTVVLLEE